ncbi:MAG: retroviral-like aspartic protease family protein [Chloroflexi bacterium]|nr:retroviral-like aspartic protease family protein [Chloroflexota bacterium]
MRVHYNARYTPAIPILQASFGYGNAGRLPETFEAIVDTGADATIVPEDIARRLRASPLNPAHLETQWGDVHPVTMYLLDIQIGEVNLPSVVVAGDPESDEIILGRNVLNKLALFLDGPAQQTDVLDDTMVNRLRHRRQ